MEKLRNIFFILASGSQRRIDFLSSLDLNFKIEKSLYTENSASFESATEYSLKNAYLKALSVAERNRNTLVAGFDTVVEIKGKVLGKPQDKTEACSMLRELSGKTHNVITAYCLINLERNIIKKEFVVTEVTFKSLENEEIEWYVNTKEPFDKAGAYAVQGIGAFMIKKINGSYSNVVGLPLTEFLEDLSKFL